MRVRMTLLYGGLFTIIAVGVLLGALELQRQATSQQLGQGGRSCVEQLDQDPAACANPPVDPESGRPDGQGRKDPASTVPQDVRDSVLSSQRIILLAATTMIVLLAFAVCWWLTGRLLRPLHRITAAAQRLSLSTMHERIALTGPDDELRRLADTFDAMLERLERAVESQRRFIANASHELRTPLAVQRTAIEVGLAGPSPERLARIRAELLRNTLRSERLIEGLLQLANGERGPDVRLSVDLSAVVGEVVEESRARAAEAGVTLGAPVMRPVAVLGDEVMLRQLVTNLVQNAISYNVPGGEVRIELGPDGELVVANTGQRVPAERVDELFEPFRRLDADRTGSGEGAGLGLSIVAAIVRAHGGAIVLRPNPDGGLTVRVDLPIQPAPPEPPEPSCRPAFFSQTS